MPCGTPAQTATALRMLCTCSACRANARAYRSHDLRMLCERWSAEPLRMLCECPLNALPTLFKCPPKRSSNALR
eukprot:464543-Lingulodinium_polyedra.AAC.1